MCCGEKYGLRKSLMPEGEKTDIARYPDSTREIGVGGDKIVVRCM